MNSINYTICCTFLAFLVIIYVIRDGKHLLTVKITS